MRIKTVVTLGALALFVASVAVAGEREDRFYDDVASYYGDTLGVVDQLVEMGIADEDLAVCMHVAKETQTTPLRIGEVRKRGDSWMEIIRGRGVKINSLFFLISGKYESKIYKPIFAKFTALPESKWNELQFSDAEIINLVNLRCIYQHHDYSVFEVMAMRDIGKKFVTINEQIGDLKKEMIKAEKAKKKAKAAEAGSN